MAGADGRALARGAGVVLALAMVAPAAAPAEAPRVRVRLLHSGAPVTVTTGSVQQTVAPHASGLRVDGRVASGRLRLPPPGPHRLAGRRYRGAIEFIRVGRGLDVVNEIPLEAYVAGTLLREVDGTWGDEALRAQAVAIRSYALHRQARSRGGHFELEADTTAQVYGGLDAEAPQAWAAVDATRGVYLAWGDAPILAAFHGTAGGRTASAEEVWGEPLPYLVSRTVPGEEASPDTYWRLQVGAGELAGIAAAQRSVGPIEAVRVLAHAPSGRVARLALVGRGGSVELSGRELRRALGATRLRSTLFRVRTAPGGFVFVGSGYGHGVGMSQWGARALGRQGADYRRILATFYPGAELRRLPGTARAANFAVEAGAR